METTFKITTNEFLQELQSVGAVINPKMTIPALTYIYCELAGNKLLLIGNNSEQQVETSIEVLEPTGDISFLIEKEIIGILKTLPEQPLKIIIDADKSSMLLEHSSGDFKFKISDVDTYPKLKVIQSEEKDILILPAGRFKSGIEKNSKQMADDELRSVMNGVFVDIMEDKIVFVGSDGHRLSKYTDMALSGNAKNSFLLPRNTVPVLIKQLSLVDSEQDIQIEINSRNVSIEIDEVKITTRLIEGRYPNYDSVIPKANDKFLVIDSKELSTIIARLLITSNNMKAICIKTDQKQTIFSSEDLDFDKSAKEYTNYKCNGDITIGLKGTFLLDILSNLSGDIQFSFSEPMRAVLINPVEQIENTDYTLLIMPMMLNN